MIWDVPTPFTQAVRPQPEDIATWLSASDGKLAMTRRFQLCRDRDGATVLRGRWALVCIELSSGRARRMPAEFVVRYGGAVQA